MWIDEEPNYDHVKMACKCQPERSKCMCGHYTQLVWSTTKAVGCGNVTCNNELGVLIVCSYNPPGNYQDENPFQYAHPLPSSKGARKPRRKRHHGHGARWRTACEGIMGRDQYSTYANLKKGLWDLLYACTPFFVFIYTYLCYLWEFTILPFYVNDVRYIEG